MVVDELVARFGFIVNGVEALKRAMQRLREFVKGVLASVAPSKKAAQALNPLKQSLEKTARAAAPATARMQKFGTAMRVVALGVAGLVTATAAAAVGVAALGAAFAAAGLRAARARRELQLDAVSKGTDAKRLQVLKNVAQAATGANAKTSDGYIESAVEKIADKIREARRGDEDALKSLKQAGISPVDPGNRSKAKDSSSAFYELLQSFIRDQEKIRKLNSEADSLKSPRAAKAKRAKAEELRIKAEKQADEFGIGPELVDTFSKFTAKQLEEATLAAASRAPGPTTLEEDRNAALSKSFAELQQKLSTIGDAIAKPFSDFAKFMAEKVIGPLNDFADAMIKFGKKIGLIAETRQEQDARTENERQDSRRDVYAEAARVAERRRKKVEDDAAALRQRHSGPSNWSSLADWISSFMSNINSTGIQSLNKSATGKTEEVTNNDNRVDQGADKRNQTVNNNITVSGLDAITSAIKAGIAPLLAKSANTATSGSGSP